MQNHNTFNGYLINLSAKCCGLLITYRIKDKTLFGNSDNESTNNGSSIRDLADDRNAQFSEQSVHSRPIRRKSCQRSTSVLFQRHESQLQITCSMNHNTPPHSRVLSGDLSEYSLIFSMPKFGQSRRSLRENHQNVDE